jgi:NADPH:quinone reductase-like Zn-dependent oxidoreductase
MRAVVYSQYGSPDVLRYEDIAKPSAKEDEVLIEIRAASVNPLDWHFMRGTPYLVRIVTGLRKPKFSGLGVDVAGQVQAVGAKVTLFKVGDDVFGACRGAFAEYVCTSETTLVKKPANRTFEQAAAAPIAAFTALQSFRKGKLHAGQKVLVNGAAGGVGTFAVQIAKSYGADVTGVCSSRNLDMVRSIGADSVMDYTLEDFTKTGQGYDLILDMVGNHTLMALRRALKPNGICVMSGGPTGRWKMGLARGVRAQALSLFGSRKLIGCLARANRDDLAVMQGLLESGKVTPVIDRRYGLSEVPQAIRYLEEGHARGKIVVTLG